MKLVVVVLLLLVSFVVYVLLSEQSATETNQTPEKAQATSHLLTLAAPRVDDEYYSDSYAQIVDFQIEYARRVLAGSTDQVQILADQPSIDRYGDQLPAEVFVESPMLDIWMRDFTTINSLDPIQFIYTDASMSAAEARATQAAFREYAEVEGRSYRTTDYVLDGGNIVDDTQGRVITTTRFLVDNNLTKSEGKRVLRDLLNASEVAIIESDDDVLAHSDGMVAWIDDGVLAMNDYSTIDPELHTAVLNELTTSFPDSEVVLLPVVFDSDTAGIDAEISSACGVNINLVATPSTLYVPVFDMPHDTTALELIRQNTTKQVIEIPASGVCRYGGSARCTVWQQSV